MDRVRLGTDVGLPDRGTVICCLSCFVDVSYDKVCPDHEKCEHSHDCCIVRVVLPICISDQEIPRTRRSQNACYCI